MGPPEETVELAKYIISHNDYKKTQIYFFIQPCRTNYKGFFSLALSLPSIKLIILLQFSIVCMILTIWRDENPAKFIF